MGGQWVFCCTPQETALYRLVVFFGVFFWFPLTGDEFCRPAMCWLGEGTAGPLRRRVAELCLKAPAAIVRMPPPLDQDSSLSLAESQPDCLFLAE